MTERLGLIATYLPMAALLLSGVGLYVVIKEDINGLKQQGQDTNRRLDAMTTISVTTIKDVAKLQGEYQCLKQTREKE